MAALTEALKEAGFTEKHEERLEIMGKRLTELNVGKRTLMDASMNFSAARYTSVNLKEGNLTEALEKGQKDYESAQKLKDLFRALQAIGNEEHSRLTGAADQMDASKETQQKIMYQCLFYLETLVGN